MDWTNIYALADKIGDVVHKDFGVALLIMFVGGIVSSISPSSVPRMIAIVNYAGHEAKTFWSAALLSFAFVLGICIVYCGVGMLAGSFGRLLMMTGLLYYVTAALCFIMGLQLIRLVELKMKLPALPVLSHGFVGAFLLGFGFAFLIAPDAMPVMLGALAVTTFRGEIFNGAILMLAFGVGHGIPVFFVGSFAPWYTRSGWVKRWHLVAEMAAGYILVFLALFFAVIA
ncbi:MAG TPA: cytochrome c biogenesis protein CcdA [Candidatus Eremiobacteraceae bacterium]|nr:cytochrome c biogenesis protein CcdA [Candidatus Eremiobacteraceae bacterium]